MRLGDGVTAVTPALDSQRWTGVGRHRRASQSVENSPIAVGGAVVDKPYRPDESAHRMTGEGVAKERARLSPAVVHNGDESQGCGSWRRSD
jgi:hypothetical protein